MHVLRKDTVIQMDTGVVHNREEREQNEEIPLKVRESIDAYVADYKSLIADFMGKLTLETNQDIDRYKEEIIAKADIGMIGDSVNSNAIEVIRGCLCDLETQSSGQISEESREAVSLIRTIEWIKELEKHALKHKLTPENLSALEKCKKQITAENMNWSDIRSAVEKLLESISHELLPDTGENDEGMKTVSIQVFKLQIQKISKKCHIENESAVEFIVERGKAVVRKTYGSMQKISTVKISLTERKNENLYLEFFLNIKKEFDKAAALLFRELIKNASQSYDQILDEMNKMFQSIGEYLPGKGDKKLYGEYESKKKSLDQEMADKAETLEFGGSEIVAFGYKIKDTIKNIGRKWNQKRKIFATVPILIFLCGFLFEAVITQGQIENITNNIGVDFLYSMAAFISMLFANLKSLLVFTVLLIVAFYVVYLKLLKLWCNSQIDKQCDEYFKIQLTQFKHDNTIKFQLEDTVRKNLEEYEQQNLAALEQLFSAIERGSTGTEQTDVSWFLDLKAQWSEISA